MFNFLKADPVKKLEKQYKRLLTEARDLQRSGDIQGYSAKSAEAEAVYKEMMAHSKESD